VLDEDVGAIGCCSSTSLVAFSPVDLGFRIQNKSKVNKQHTMYMN